MRHKLQIMYRTTQTLSGSEIESLSQLFQRVSTGDRATFVHGLLSLHEVFLVWSHGEIVGFGGVNVFEASYKGETASLIYTARVCLHPHVRGANVVQFAGLHYFLREKCSHPTRPVYWFFCAGSSRSYLLLARNLRVYWPRPGAEMPERERALILEVARQMNHPGLDPVAMTMFEEGVVYEGRDVPGDWQSLADPDLAYYARHIAPLRLGEEILCLAPLTLTNWLSAFRRMAQRRIRQAVRYQDMEDGMKNSPHPGTGVGSSPGPGLSPGRAGLTTVRQAREEDAQACVELTYCAMPGIFHFWVADDEAMVKRCLRVLFAGAPSLYSRHMQWVVEQDNQVVAAMCVAPGSENARARRGLFTKLPRLWQILGTTALVRCLWRSLVLARQSHAFGDDELVVYTMAVLPEYRRRRISILLREQMLRQARDLGLKKVIGVTEANNTQQITIVEALGYRLVATHERSSLRRYGLHAVLKWSGLVRQPERRTSNGP